MRVSGELRAMRRWLPITIVLAAAVAEAVGLGQIAFYLLLVAVPLVAATALTSFGELLDSPLRAGGVAPGAALRRGAAPARRRRRGRIDGVRALRPVWPRSRSRPCSGSASSYRRPEPDAAPRAVATSAALRAKSTSGCTAKNEPTLTTIAMNAALESMISRGGEPPTGASPSSAAGRMYIARITAR